MYCEPVYIFSTSYAIDLKDLKSHGTSAEDYSML